MEQLDFWETPAFFIQIDQQIFLVELKAFFINKDLVVVAHNTLFWLMNIYWLQMHVWLTDFTFSLLKIIILVFLLILVRKLFIKALSEDLVFSILKLREFVMKIREWVISESHPRIDATVENINL